MIGVLATPAWLLPAPWSQVWLVATLLFAGPSLWVSWRYSPWLPTPAGELDRVEGALKGLWNDLASRHDALTKRLSRK